MMNSVSPIRRIVGGAVLATLAFMAATPSNAAVYTLTASGTIMGHDPCCYTEFDRAGLFGPAVGDLAGKPFEFSFRVDTSLLRTVYYSTPARVYFESGMFAAPPTDGNGITASIAIGGKLVPNIGEQTAPFATTGIVTKSRMNFQRTPSGQYIDIHTASVANSQSDVYRINGKNYPGLQLGMNFSFYNRLQPTETLFDSQNNLVPFALQFSADDYNTVSGYLSSYSSVTGQFDEFDFVTRNVSLTTALSVPEPASWALMIGGFGVVGGCGRRVRRRKTKICASYA